MWWSLLAALAWGQECPDLAERMTSARALFDDAELEASKNVVAEAMGALDCQGRVLTTEQLLELYRLDTLVSITQADRKSATYATLRAIAAEHTAVPDESRYGPLLVSLWNTWSERLSADLIPVRVAGAGLVWVDGRQIDHSQILYVAAGEHLIQTRANGTLKSELVELTESHVVETGEPGPGPAEFPPEGTSADESGESEGEDTVLPVATSIPSGPTEAGRRRPWGYFVGGALVGLAGGGAMAWAAMEEERFLADPYLADSYGGCDRSQACWAQGREDAISQDALLINVGYGAGYGLLAAGTALVGVGVVGTGTRTSVHFNFRF